MCELTRYELPEQHEPLVVLLPEKGSPWTGLTSEGLAEEISGRRAEGATAALVFDQAMLTTARESGLLLEEEGGEEEEERGKSWSDKGARETCLPLRKEIHGGVSLFGFRSARF